MRYFLGLDISTTATKALLIDDSGTVAAVHSEEYGLSTPNPLWSEQDPHDWWAAASDSTRAVLLEAGIPGEAVKGIGLTGQMHGLVLLEASGSVLRPAILWNDQRSAAQCEAIRERVGRQELVARTGNDAFPGFTAPKLLWVRDHEPELYGKIAQVLLPKDYVRFRLTGEYGTDKAGAGGTLLLDLAQRDWSRQVLDALEVPPRWLPPTFEGPEVTGRVTRQASEATGLAEGTPVVAGGGDQAAQAVGVGAVAPGVVALTLGTSGVVFTSCDEPTVEPEGRVHAFPHAVPNRWHVMGVMLSAAGSLRWHRDAVAPEADYPSLLREAERVDPGSDGLFFMPYLSGERTPHADPNVRGAFVGLTLQHGRPHMTRAVLEGVAYGLQDNLLLLRRVGVQKPDQVRVSGGGARGRLWKQILADVMEVELVSVQTEEGAAYGAALLAAVGADAWPSVDDACRATIRTKDLVTPRTDAAAVYSVLHERFGQLYPALSPFYREHRGE
jgi:xylulokinase